MFEQNTANWDTAGARTNMEAALAANNNDVDAVLSENDGMATGVIAALDAVGLDDPGRRAGRRQGRPQPRRPRDPDRLRVEERQ